MSAMKMRMMCTMAVAILALMHNACAESRLWCVSADGHETWKAPVWKNTVTNFLLEDESGQKWGDQIWMYGELQGMKNIQLWAYSNYMSDAHGDEQIGYLNFPYNVDLGYVLPSRMNSPKEYCDALVKICTDQFGNNFRFVGASGSVVINGGISMLLSNEIYTCPNWRINQSAILYGGTKYQVSCIDPQKPQTIFVQSGDDPYIWSNGKIKYKVSEQISLLDDDIGYPYCSGNPGI